MHASLVPTLPGRALVALPITLGLLLAATGGIVRAGDIATLASPGPDAAATAAPTETETDPAQAMLDFTQCMRDHGIDMPDPQFTGDGRVFVVEERPGGGGGGGGGSDDDDDDSIAAAPFEDPVFTAANEACRDLLEAAMPPIEPEQQAEMQAEALAFAQCMRDHGIDMPDPQFGSNGGVAIQLGGPDGEGFDPRSPEFQEARETCGGAFGSGAGPDAEAPVGSDAP